MHRSVLAFLLLIAGSLTVGTTVYSVWQHFSPVPYWDSWDGTIGFYMRLLQTPVTAFFEQHNEHRLVVSRLVFLTDVRYFGGRNAFSLTANLVLAGVLALAMYRIGCRHLAPLTRAASFGLLGVVLIFTFSWIQWENFTWGFQSQWFAVYLFALLSFHCLDRSHVWTEARNSGHARAWLVAALLSGSLAAGSMASGVLVLPLLFVQAIYLRERRTHILAIGVVTIAVWLAYFFNWHTPSSNTDLRTGLSQHLVQSIHYALLYLGAPASYGVFGPRGADFCGLLFAVTLLALCVRAVQRGPRKTSGIALLALALFVAGNSMLTAGGRVSLGLGTALGSRYTTASLSAWLALLMFLAANMSIGRRPWVACIAVLASVLIAYNQPTALSIDRQPIYMRDVAGLALRSHVYDPAVTAPIYPFPDGLHNMARKAEAQHLSIFSEDQTDYPAPPQKIVTDLKCSGFVDDVAATETQGTYRAKGWIYNGVNHRVPYAVAVTDANGNTIGSAVVGGPRPDVGALYGKSALYSDWTAFFSAASGEPFKIVGRTSKDQWCAIAESGVSVPAAPKAP